MNSSTDQIISNSLSLRLKQETAAEHERMHQLMSEERCFQVKKNTRNLRCLNITFSVKLNIFLRKKG